MKPDRFMLLKKAEAKERLKSKVKRLKGKRKGWNDGM